MELALLDFDNTLTNSSSIVLDETIKDMKTYLTNNKICIISNSSFNELNDFKNKNNLNLSFFSLKDLMGIIDEKEFNSLIDYNIINNIIKKFENYIYTAWSTNSKNSYIYNFQDRLNLFYPKENKIIFNELNINLPTIYIAINIGCYDEFYSYLDSINLGYEIIAKDLKRNIVKIFNNDFKKEFVFKKIINYFNLKTIGIGDNIDNLDFINLCDEKVSMKNSNLSNIIKKTTNYDLDNNGCLEYLINR